MDYGLISLFAVQLIIAFLTFQAWRSVKAEADRITAQDSTRKAEATIFVSQMDALGKRVDEAARISGELKGSYYDALMRRIDTAEATVLGYGRQVESFLERLTSVSARVSAIQRHSKKELEKEAEAVPDGAAHPEAIRFQMEQQIPPGVVLGHFGRVAKK